MEPNDFNYQDIFSNIFDAAKKNDEFEFCCTLMRIRGAESPGWDTLNESNTLTQQLLSLIHSPLQPDFKLRLTLFLYCHLTEMSDFYSIPANMLRIIDGERYSMNPFNPTAHNSGKEAKYPIVKIERISEWADDAGHPGVSDLYRNLLVKEVRNAFFHSDYILTDDSFNIRLGDPVRIESSLVHKVPLEWLIPRLELGINASLALTKLLFDSIGSYKSDKVIRGRFNPDGSYTNITLTADPEQGLTGFTA